MSVRTEVESGLAYARRGHGESWKSLGRRLGSFLRDRGEHGSAVWRRSAAPKGRVLRFAANNIWALL